MGMEGGVGRKCIPAAWGMGAKLCDSCKAAAALLFCRVDSVFLCIGCDTKVHHRGGVGNTRHERVWMCDVCEQAPASVTCKADAAALCVTCDGDVHSANLLAHRHERVPVTPFYDLAESVAKSAVAASNFLKITEDQSTHTCLVDPESDPPPWVSPNPTTKLPPVDPTEMKSLELLFSDSDQFLDFDCPIGIHDSGTDSVVPVQPMKSLPPTTQQMMNPSSDNYLEIDFSSPKFNSFNNNNNNNNNNSCFTAQSLTHSFSSSSMDVGVVPDGSSMSEISYSYGKISNNTVDLGGPVNTASFSHGSDREARVLRYREKRKNRKFEKTIRYASRKAYAETRPRIKGRFAKRTEMDTEPVNRYFNSGSNFAAEDASAGYGVVPSFS